MSRVVARFAWALAAVLSVTSVASAQQTTTTTETKRFEAISVEGNSLVVKLPEGTKELTVPEDVYPFYFVGSAPQQFIVRAVRVERALPPR